jgi:hypothetical protein
MELKKVKLFLLIMLIVSQFFVISIALAASYLGSKADNFGLDTAASYAEMKNVPINSASNTPLTLANTIINVSLTFLAVVFFLLALYAGFKWMIALGNSEQAEKSKEVLEAALIGLVIILTAYGVSYFVFKVMGINYSTTPGYNNINCSQLDKTNCQLPVCQWDKSNNKCIPASN